MAKRQKGSIKGRWGVTIVTMSMLLWAIFKADLNPKYPYCGTSGTVKHTLSGAAASTT